MVSDPLRLDKTTYSMLQIMLTCLGMGGAALYCGYGCAEFALSQRCAVVALGEKVAHVRRKVTTRRQ